MISHDSSVLFVFLHIICVYMCIYRANAFIRPPYPSNATATSTHSTTHPSMTDMTDDEPPPQLNTHTQTEQVVLQLLLRASPREAHRLLLLHRQEVRAVFYFWGVKYIHIYIYIYLCICAYIDICLYICLYIYICMCVHVSSSSPASPRGPSAFFGFPPSSSSFYALPGYHRHPAPKKPKKYITTYDKN